MNAPNPNYLCVVKIFSISAATVVWDPITWIFFFFFVISSWVNKDITSWKVCKSSSQLSQYGKEFQMWTKYLNLAGSLINLMQQIDLWLWPCSFKYLKHHCLQTQYSYKSCQAYFYLTCIMQKIWELQSHAEGSRTVSQSTQRRIHR